MYNPKISIIIPVYNGSNYLDEAIKSALSQTYKNFEIIVVNDGSKDNGESEKIALSYGNKIRYFYKENGGVSTALNLGIEKMSGDYFLWLSHDDLVKPSILEIFVNHLQDLSPETILYGNYDLIDENSIVYKQLNFLKSFSRDKLQYSIFPVVGGVINGCVTLIHKSHFLRVGLFNPELLITQDNDMWFRILRNQKVYFCEETLGSKRYHKGQDSATKNVYPDEDAFIANMLSQLTVLEACKISGSPYEFYSKKLFEFSDGKHPLIVSICTEKLEALSDQKEYDNITAEEIKEILPCINNSVKKLYEENNVLSSKLNSLLLHF